MLGGVNFPLPGDFDFNSGFDMAMQAQIKREAPSDPNEELPTSGLKLEACKNGNVNQGGNLTSSNKANAFSAPSRGEAHQTKAAAKMKLGGSFHEAVDQLMAMGFSKAKADRALQATNHDVERAANWLLLGS
jgi:hypothetical protein